MQHARYLIFVGLFAMIGCAGSPWQITGMNPTEIRAVSDRDLCRTYTSRGFYSGATPTVEGEVKRRGLDCSYAAAENEAAAQRSLGLMYWGTETMRSAEPQYGYPQPAPAPAVQPCRREWVPSIGWVLHCP